MKVRVAYRIKSRMFETPMSNLPHLRLEPWVRCDRCSGLSGCSTVAEPGSGWRCKGLARRKRGVFMSRWCWPECPRHLTLRGCARRFFGHESFVLVCPDSIGLVTISGGPLVRAFGFFFQCCSRSVFSSAECPQESQVSSIPFLFFLLQIVNVSTTVVANIMPQSMPTLQGFGGNIFTASLEGSIERFSDDGKQLSVWDGHVGPINVIIATLAKSPALFEGRHVPVGVGVSAYGF